MTAAARPANRKSASHGEAGYERRAHDFYPTEPWVTRALLAAVEFAPAGKSKADTVIWEPACGDGRMALPLVAAGYQLISSDIADWGYGESGVDFLDSASGEFVGSWLREIREVADPRATLDAIVTNPPFDQAVLFIGRALQLTQPGGGKVAILQRHEFDAPRSNHALFNTRPFAAKLVLPRRPRWSDEPDTASPRFPYAWYLWDWTHSGPPALRYLTDPDVAPKALGRLL